MSKELKDAVKELFKAGTAGELVEVINGNEAAGILLAEDLKSDYPIEFRDRCKAINEFLIKAQEITNGSEVFKRATA